MDDAVPTVSEDGAAVLSEVCTALSAGQQADAAAILKVKYPFTPHLNAGRQYTPKQCMAVFVRDGFIDRYSGRRLVFPGTMRLLTKLLPEAFPFHPNWKTEVCHFAFYELFPTIDHVLPVSRGGLDDISNWVSTSMLRNAAKSNFTLAQLGWSLHRPGDIKEWDGLTGWFLAQARSNPTITEDAYLRRWHTAAKFEFDEGRSS